MSTLYLLFENAAGYSLFQRTEGEQIGSESSEFQQDVLDYARFSRLVKLVSFLHFTSAEQALENIKDVAEGSVNPTLKSFLEMNLTKSKSAKSGSFSLGVIDEKLGGSIQDALKIKVEKSSIAAEFLRGIRFHLPKFLKDMKESDIDKAQLGLGHSYSRNKVQFNVHRVDNMIIQSISLLDQLDKDLNTFAMRCREWYSWHFPELIRIVSDNIQFARLSKFIKNKEELNEESLPGLEEITQDAAKAQEVLEAARSSMGTAISELDMINIVQFADRVIALAEYRQKLHTYLSEKMHAVAPNLSALIGEQVGARLISHAGSLTNLAKCPASTVQILGAEKALFRALKTRGNTPKYGLIYHSGFITKAATKNKGRISRYLANKCAIAARIDSFSDSQTTKFGDKMKDQVQERLDFYDTGKLPRKNVDIMQEVLQEVAAEGLTVESSKKKKSKRASTANDEEMADVAAEVEEETRKKDKKAKKEKKEKKAAVEEEPVVEMEVDEKKKEKKSKKDKKEKKQE